MIEREMEDLIAAYTKEFFPRKDMVLKGRQKSFSEVGRFDLLFEDEHDTNVLVELKARTAKYEDASQLAKYKDALEKAGERNILMWLVAPQIPKSVRDFLDRIGIEYTEIHEAEYRNVAARHGYTIESESEKTQSPIDTLPLQTTWSPVISGRRGSGASDFLDRCHDDRARAFFSAFFERQQTLAKKTLITWDHQSGFSMQFKFQRLGHVAMVWGLPAANHDGKIITGERKNRLEFPLDFAARRGVPQVFLHDFVEDLQKGIYLAGGSKRPAIPVSDLTQSETEHILNTIFSYAEKASSIS